MYNHPDSQLCYQDSVHKDWIVEIIDEGRTIGNVDLYKDELTITDPLCSKDDITLGCCEAATLEFKVRNNSIKLKDKKLRVSLVLNHHENTPIPMGIFKVEEDKLEEDQKVRNVKAYDAMYELLNKDFAKWFNNLTLNGFKYTAVNPGGTLIIPNLWNKYMTEGLYLKVSDDNYTRVEGDYTHYVHGTTYYRRVRLNGGSITCKDFRDSFFEYAGITQENVNLVNDWVPFTFKVTNSASTERMLSEEKEKILQEFNAAVVGKDIIKYTAIDPSTYANYDTKTKEEYLFDYPTSSNQASTSGSISQPGSQTIGEGGGAYAGNPTYHGYMWIPKYTKVDPSHTINVNPQTINYNRGYIHQYSGGSGYCYDPSGESKSITLTPRNYDWNIGYIDQGVWKYENPTQTYIDIYVVQGGVTYTVALGAEVGTRFRAMFTTTDITTVSSGNVTGTKIVNVNNPAPYASATYTTPSNGFILVAKDNIGHSGLYSYVSHTVQESSFLDEYPVEAGHEYSISLGNQVGSRFRVLFLQPEVTTISNRTDGILIAANDSPSPGTTATFTSTQNGYFLIDKGTINIETHVTYSESGGGGGSGNPKADGWYEKNPVTGEYQKTEDTNVDPNKDYYTIDQPANYNPHTELWWVIKDKKYWKLTSDTTPKANKKYFEKVVTEWQSPVDLGWYEFIVDAYYESTDTEIDLTKTYFIKETIERPKPTYKKVNDVKSTDNPAENKWYECLIPSTYHEVNPGGTLIIPNLWNKYVGEGLYTRSGNQYTQVSGDYTHYVSGTTYYQKDEGVYYRSEATTVDLSRDYYILIAPANDNTAFLDIFPYLESHRNDNPAAQGWYEYKDNAYVRSEDQTVNMSKHYFIDIWEQRDNEREDIIEDKILGSEIIQAICEINGRFGHVDRTGTFRYLRLKPIDYSGEGLYPAPDLYPDPNLYPQAAPFDTTIERGQYEEIERSDFLVKKIDRLVICKEDGDAGYIYPAGSTPENHNTYKITGNFIWYSFTGDRATLDLVGQNILTQGVAQISEYTPCTIDMTGNPCIELGDSLLVHTRLGNIATYVLKRTLTGSQRLRDTIEAQGTEKKEETNQLYDAIIALKGKSNILTRTVDETRNEIIDISEGLTSLIQQTADSIRLEVSREIKGLEDKTTEKYEAATKYTDRSITDTVSKTIFDENMDEVSRQWSEFERLSYSITASVEEKLDATGEEQGFKWVLTKFGFSLYSKGGYSQIIEPPAGANPSTLNWYQLNENLDYELTTDTHVETGKAYYTHEESANYSEVFRANANGIWIKNAVTTDYLNVEKLATIHDLEVDHLTINETITMQGQELQGNIDTVSNGVNNINTKALKGVNKTTGDINANYITLGEMSADRISTSSLRTKIINTLDIVASTQSPDQGTICIGTVKAKNFYRFNGTEYRPLTVRQVKDISGNTVNVLCTT